MQQRKPSLSGRPSGTDGSDFSYRMVVDSRYQKVANGKSRLSSLIFTQAIVQLIGLLYSYLPVLKEGAPYTLPIASASVGCFSLVIGEIGRRRSRVSLLRVCMVISSFSVLLSLFCSFKTNSLSMVMKNPSDWETRKFEILETAHALIGLLVQIFLASTINSLIGNMSPPKRAS